MSNYSYKERIDPTNDQVISLVSNVHNARAVWNLALSYCKTELAAGRKLPTLTQLSKQLTVIKNYPDFVWLKSSESTSLQVVLKNLLLAYDSMFKGIRLEPRFKSRYKAKKSFTIRCNSPLARERITDDGYFDIPKIGKVKVFSGKKRLSRFKGQVKLITITYASDGKWYMSVIVDNSLSGRPTIHNIVNNNVIGLDFGVKTSIVDNQGNSFHSPKALAKKLKQLRRLQRKLSRANKDSNNYQKLKLKIARLHAKISNTRKDWQHKLSLELIVNNEIIVLETLAIKSMMKKLKRSKKTTTLARKIADEAWFQLKTFIKYKAEFYDRIVLEVSQFFPSSKLCSHCGYKNTKLTLNTREWECKECNTFHDRDKNAAKNLEAVGEYFKLNGKSLLTEDQYLSTLHTI